MKRNTHPDYVPARLRPGDTVACCIKQKSRYWIVREVTEVDNTTQTVVASHPGQGSVRFTWKGGQFRLGHGHGLKFYYQGSAT